MTRLCIFLMEFAEYFIGEPGFLFSDITNVIFTSKQTDGKGVSIGTITSLSALKVHLMYTKPDERSIILVILKDGSFRYLNIGDGHRCVSIEEISNELKLYLEN